MNRQFTNQSDEKWAADVAQAFEQARVPERPDDQEILGLIRAAERAPAPRAADRPWRLPAALTPRRLVAAAAVVLVALMLTGIWWPDGLSPQRAFAQMVDNVRKAKTGVMDMLVAQGPDREALRSKMYVRSPSQMRQEFEDGNIVMVYDFAGGRVMSLMTRRKEASVVNLPPEAGMTAAKGAPAAGTSSGVPVDIVAAFRDLPAGQVTLAGETTEDGRDLLVYDAVDPGGDRKRVWVDKRTLFPVRLRYRGTIPGRAEPTELTFDRMQWNVELDDSLFATTPPDGYAKVTMPLAAPGPEDLVRILRLWTELSGGAFPSEFTPLGMYRLANLFNEFDQRVSNGGRDRGEAYSKAYVNLAKAAGLDMEKIDGAPTFQQQVLLTASRGASYLVVAMEKPDWHWLGKDVKVGDANRIVCYWKNDNAKTYTAIDATLQLRQLEAKDLPTSK